MKTTHVKQTELKIEDGFKRKAPFPGLLEQKTTPTCVGCIHPYAVVGTDIQGLP